MNTIELKINDELVKKFGIPKYQTQKAAALDLYACIENPIKIFPCKNAKLISTGIAISISNPNIMAMIVPRSSCGHKKGLILGNSIGIIDADYLGTIFISVWNRNPKNTIPIIIEPGERIAQLIFVPIIRTNFNIVEAFSENSVRGEKGFGSTG
ncbi:Deoxyuridine 5'-triphosphate nucleotidohydrolase [Candidatus Kinetoplastibacterium sorsogonicusi]|uniref:dUTP diphosphatase n=1 Tax=Candidatus Kinetoplastidibacterium kentomonadis TaxID=1576550 RepID=A0A3S7J9J2_9PROT|nr:dUTP diphosphatase [Candidatus Kinetoplastibacterium sorsogonicusi]AWD32342.1 Deoxyuridine 5'-triphosphate nucleotidohydrolase [Candidatus Kinetoplastibacterium sorsogonicusi]